MGLLIPASYIYSESGPIGSMDDTLVSVDLATAITGRINLVTSGMPKVALLSVKIHSGSAI